jgi:hypothetical protein
MAEPNQEFTHKAQNLMKGGNPPSHVFGCVKRISRPECRRTLGERLARAETPKGRGRKPRALRKNTLKREKVRRDVVP